jgi:hypothetical protein
MKVDLFMYEAAMAAETKSSFRAGDRVHPVYRPDLVAVVVQTTPLRIRFEGGDAVVDGENLDLVKKGGNE